MLPSWLGALPDDQPDGATAAVWLAICDRDLDELQAIQSSRGFGRH